MNYFSMLVPTLAVAVVTGCASSLPPVSTTEGSTLVQIGQVTEVRDLTVNSGLYAPAGSLVGGVLGGIAGNNVGAGTGRALTTVGGALAGGAAGQQLGRAGSAKSVTRLTVRFDTGEEYHYDVEPGERFQVGDQVKVITAQGKTTVTH
jgi:outer membrane lipoprotein SlyB